MKHYPLVFISFLLLATPVLAADNAAGKPIAEANKNTQQALPAYALDQTLQTFSKSVHGGVLHVIAKLDNNVTQIKLIQAHLLKMTNAFKQGDFSATEASHGANMPGLAQLKAAKTDEIRFDYKPLANGAQIHFSSEYPKLVQALHEWFDAQITEHGNAVIDEHSQHHAKPSE
ncbi:aspartate carbamoyltransferase [Methylomonas sp. AM2-LC]|uniref:aspartate carbamoyltransferase n=1 Tax=Methylomonas sp. AM2-LC TaxID=3153301 RepID=UPI003263E378